MLFWFSFCYIIYCLKTRRMSKLRIITSVINNYKNDLRVQKVVQSLLKMGFEVEVIATTLWGNPKLNFGYKVHILPLQNQKGMKLYGEFNWKLFQKLKTITRKGDILLANDLDAL